MKQFLGTLFTFLFPLFTFTQDFEVAPVVLNFKVEPGNMETRKVAIRNHSDKIQAFSLKLSDYEIDSVGKKKRVPAGTSKRTLADWVGINPSFFELNPNQSTEVEVTITVPPDGISSRWGIITVQATQERTALEVDKVIATGVLVQPRIAIFVSQSPRSNKNYKAVIKSFSEITKEKDTQRKFSIVVYNAGEKEIKANVTLVLSNIQTGEEKKVDMKSETMHPESTKTFELKLPPDVAKGKYALAAILDYGHGSTLEGSQLIIEQK
jgi:hypothetical protein